MRNEFSAPNESSFFVSQYGYKTDANVYAINKFGYFGPGLVFDVLDSIKRSYGSMSVVAISKACLSYITDYVTPLKRDLAGAHIEVANIADDSGRNNELVKLGKQPFKFRSY